MGTIKVHPTGDDKLRAHRLYQTAEAVEYSCGNTRLWLPAYPFCNLARWGSLVQAAFRVAKSIVGAVSSSRVPRRLHLPRFIVAYGAPTVDSVGVTCFSTSSRYRLKPDSLSPAKVGFEPTLPAVSGFLPVKSFCQGGDHAFRRGY